MKRLGVLIDNSLEATGRILAWLALLMVLLTCLIVVMRYGFDTGEIWMQELVLYLHGALFLLGLAYTEKHNGHVRVDILYSRASARTRAIIDLSGTVLFAIPVSLFILWQSYDYTLRSWRIFEGSPEVGGIPAVFLLKTLIPLAMLLFLLQCLRHAVHLIAQLNSRASDAGAAQ